MQPNSAYAASWAPSDPLAGAVWHALCTAHQGLAVVNGQARRYPAAVAPFGAVEAFTPEALDDLHELLAPDEAIYLMSDAPFPTSKLRQSGAVPCLQMVFPGHAAVPDVLAAPCPLLSLDCFHAEDMLELITLAYPGFFRPETCRMGRYWGLRDETGRLLAMGGERLVVSLPGQPAWKEVSGLCVHPDHAGHGYGTTLLCHILGQHRAEGAHSWLHVAESNSRAAALYRLLGFEMVRSLVAYRLQRNLS